MRHTLIKTKLHIHQHRNSRNLSYILISTCVGFQLYAAAQGFIYFTKAVLCSKYELPAVGDGIIASLLIYERRHGDTIGKAMDLRFTGLGFESWLGTIVGGCDVGKLLTPVCLSHQAV